ncbi:WbqC family protein [Roseivirga sp.]|uniref:WbqC family protein n=2 Tax=Roseivirga sp. TaxID=1964215 RepID=UPI0023564FC0|nr:WbqC family protein [Roseivirga sp.]
MVAIMQPYFIPYLGYIQLLAAVDKFVVYDDVNYINRGWINRNNLLIHGQKQMMTMPLTGASQNKKINEINISAEPKWRSKLLRTIEMSYKRAPHFNEVFELTQRIIEHKESNLSAFLTHQLQEIARYLNLKTEIIVSSERFNNTELKKGNRLIDICHELEDLQYINPIGGAQLYTKEQFAEKGVELRFLEMKSRPYDQIKTDQFVPYLSIVDVLMMNSTECIIDVYLSDFNLI